MVTKKAFPFSYQDMNEWSIRHHNATFRDSPDLFNKLCVMFKCTDAESVEEAMEKVITSIKNMGED
jgi:hypothetical protein